VTESPTEHHHAPAPADPADAAAAPAEAAETPPRPAWRRAAASVLGTAAVGSAAGVPF
jgi:hypothetical protein